MSCGAVNRRFPLLLRTLCILAGIALPLWTSGHFRIDEVRCWSWPSVQIGVLFSVVFSVGLALLSYGYLSILSLYEGTTWTAPADSGIADSAALAGLCRSPSFGDAAACAGDAGAAVSVRRSTGLCRNRSSDAPVWQGMYTPLGVSLPEADPVRMAIQWEPEWLSVGSAYAPGFNWLASLLVRLSGTGVAANLQSFSCSAWGVWC